MAQVIVSLVNMTLVREDWILMPVVEDILIYREGSPSSRMRVIYHNWSATKQRPRPQSVAEISHHSVLSGDRI